MVRKFLFYTTMIFPMIICAILLEGIIWFQDQIHAYYDWVVKE